MPKATLTFSLPDERVEYASAMHGGEWKSIVSEVAMLLRNSLKYGHPHKDADAAFEAVKKLLWEQCDEFHLDPWGD